MNSKVDRRLQAIYRRVIGLSPNALPVALCLMMVFAFPLGAQSGRTGGQISLPQPIGQRNGSALEDSWSNDPAEQAKRLRDLNAARQKNIVSDAEKLLKLAVALKAQADSSDTQTSVAQQVNQWSQVEHLARGIREKMSYAPPSSFGYTPFGANR